VIAVIAVIAVHGRPVVAYWLEKRDRELYVDSMREKEREGMSKRSEYLCREVSVD
jgi:hypothetical protein